MTDGSNDGRHCNKNFRCSLTSVDDIDSNDDGWCGKNFRCSLTGDINDDGHCD